VGAPQGRLFRPFLQFLIVHLPGEPAMPATSVLRPVLAVLLSAACALGYAQKTLKAPGAYEPTVGQEGKDVVWVPTPQALVDTMLNMAGVTARDIVIDLGSGDGRTVITAARRGAQATGIEYNPAMVALSRRNAQAAGVGARATFMKADLFETDLSKATVITMFLLPEINLRLRPRLLALKPGTRVVSNTFSMDDWSADESITLTDAEGCTESWCTALLWIIPARVAGTYDIPLGRVVLKQEYQVLSGTLRAEGKTYALEGKVRGEDLMFRAAGREFKGRVQGGRLVLK
jgi:precorrin-6B methylase 2